MSSHIDAFLTEIADHSRRVQERREHDVITVAVEEMKRRFYEKH